MFRTLLIALVALWTGLAWAPAPAHAQDGAWRITARTGIVRLREPGHAPRDAQPGESLALGTVVTTGANSTATVENNAQRMTMSANSRMTIARTNAVGMTRILQDLGSILFQVDRQRVQHFQVETPHLAAVVKGTTFTVTVTPQFDRVAVSAGLVEVRANQGGAVREVPGGESASILSSAPGALQLSSEVDATTSAGGSSGSAGPLGLRGGFTEASDTPASSETNAPEQDASVSGNSAQSPDGVLEGAAQAARSRMSNVAVRDTEALVRFIITYLLGSFAAGLGFFYVVRLIERFGSAKHDKARRGV